MKWEILETGKPPVGVPLIVTIHDTFRNRKELRYPVYYQKSLFPKKQHILKFKESDASQNQFASLMIIEKVF